LHKNPNAHTQKKISKTALTFEKQRFNKKTIKQETIMYIVKIKKMLRVVLEYRKNGNGMKTLAKR
jgi:hypothetical protein